MPTLKPCPGQLVSWRPSQDRNESKIWMSEFLWVGTFPGWERVHPTLPAGVQPEKGLDATGGAGSFCPLDRAEPSPMAQGKEMPMQYLRCPWDPLWPHT